MSNVYVHFSLISFPARYSVVNFQLESHSLRFREVIIRKVYQLTGKNSLRYVLCRLHSFSPFINFTTTEVRTRRFLSDSSITLTNIFACSLPEVTKFLWCLKLPYEILPLLHGFITFSIKFYRYFYGNGCMTSEQYAKSINTLSRAPLISTNLCAGGVERPHQVSMP